MAITADCDSRARGNHSRICQIDFNRFPRELSSPLGGFSFVRRGTS
jgi:hypothetical protein